MLFAPRVAVGDAYAVQMSQVTTSPPSVVPAASPGPSEAPRLGWLDLLRGIAALMVALQHAMYYFTPAAWTQMSRWVDPGKYGVLLFFLISGYIIPASLERRGSVRDFWTGRVLRIYPMLLVTCALLLVPLSLGWFEPRRETEGMDPLVGAVAHLTMLQDLLEDAVLMGVDEGEMRRILAELVAALPSPRRAGGGA